MIDVKSSLHYDKIVNFLYEDNNSISKLLIENYQEYLLWVKNKNSKKKMDIILDEYTEKKDFYRFVQNEFNLDVSNELLEGYDRVMRKLLKLYHQFEQDKLRKVNSTRWI